MSVSRKLFRILSVLLMCAILFNYGVSASAQNELDFHIRYIDDQAFPAVKVYVAVTDTKGNLAPDFKKGDFFLFEDDKPVTNFNLTSAINAQQPLDLVLAVDIGRAPEADFKNLIAATTVFINSLRPQDQVALLIFSNQSKVLKELSADKHQIPGMLEKLVADGPSPIYYDALINAQALLKDSVNPKGIILISNKVNAQITPEKENDFLKMVANQRTQIFPVGFGATLDQQKLNAIVANQTGGKTFYLPGVKGQADELAEAFGQLAIALDKQLRFQYLLQYESKLKPTGQKHTLKASMSYQGWAPNDGKSFISCAGVLKVCLPAYMPENTVAAGACVEPIVYPVVPPVKRLEGFLDGKSFCNETAAPFECCIDANASGSHSYKFTVTDAANQTGEVSGSLLLRPAFKIDVKSPLVGDVVLGKLTLVAHVDALSPLTKIQFKVDDQIIDEIVNPKLPAGDPPFKYIFEKEIELGATPGGKHVFNVVALGDKNLQNIQQLEINIGGITSNSQPWPIMIAAAIIGVAVVLLLISTRRRGSKEPGNGNGVDEGQAGLREMEGLYPNRVWSLNSPEVRLGRKAEENDIPLQGLGASRRMAVIRSHEGCHYIYSLNPQNPVLVNNIPVLQQQVLQHGDVIRLGDSLYQYQGGK